MEDLLRWNKAFALEQAADDEELLRELLGIFKESCGKDVETIEKAIVESNAVSACNSAHSIKGAAASLGMEGFREVAYEIENDSRGGSLSCATQRVPELKNMLSLLHQLDI